VPLGVVQHLLVAPAGGALHPGGQPVHTHRLAGGGHLRKQRAQVVQGGDEAAVGLAEAQRAKLAKQQIQAVAHLGLEIPTARPARRYDSPSSSTAATASRRTSNASGGVPPRPDGRGGVRWARRPASQASTSTGSDERGQYDNGDQTSKAGFDTSPMVWSPSTSGRTEHHGHSQWSEPDVEQGPIVVAHSRRRDTTRTFTGVAAQTVTSPGLLASLGPRGSGPVGRCRIGRLRPRWRS
jgi:hypothetical protein